MATKTLNTRIQLKHDSLSNWLTNDPVLLPGEIAVAFLDNNANAEGTGKDSSGLTPPAVGIKVGAASGDKKFSELNWIQAIAGDVYSWAKAATKPTYKASEIEELSDYIAGEIEDTDTQYRVVLSEGKVILQKKNKGQADSEFVEASSITLPTYSLTTGTEDGTVAFNGTNVAVKGLKSAAYTDSTDYATSTQGAKADTAVQKISLGETDLVINGSDRSVTITLDNLATLGVAKQADLTITNENVGKAQTAAEGAQSAAEAAQSTANQAVTAAGTAQTTIDNYKTSNDGVVAQLRADLTTEASTARAAEKANADAIAAIKDDANIDSFADVVAALANKQDSGDYATKTEAQGMVDALANGQVKTNTEAIAAINNAETGILKQAKDYADGKDGAIAEAKGLAENAGSAASKAQGDVDALAGKVGTVPEGQTVMGIINNIQENAYDDTELRGLIGDNAEAISGHGERITALETHSTNYEAKVNTLIGEDANKSARTIANEELAKQLIAEGAQESLDTLAEIAQWIQDHPGDAAAMNKSIEDLEALVGTLPEDITATTVVGYIQELVNAEKSRAEGIEGGLESRLSAVEGKLGADGDVDTKIATAKQEAIDAAATTAQGKADAALASAKTYTDDEIKKLGSMATETATDYIKKTEAPGYDDILTATSAKSTYEEIGVAATKAGEALTGAKEYTNTEIGKLAAIAKSGNVNDLVQTTGDYLIFNCGTSNTVI